MISFLKANWLDLSFALLGISGTMASLYGALVMDDPALRFMLAGTSIVVILRTYGILSSMKWSINGNTKTD